MKEVAKFFSGPAANQALTNGAMAIGGHPFLRVGKQRQHT